MMQSLSPRDDTPSHQNAKQLKAELAALRGLVPPCWPQSCFLLLHTSLLVVSRAVQAWAARDIVLQASDMYYLQQWLVPFDQWKDLQPLRIANNVSCRHNAHISVSLYAHSEQPEPAVSRNESLLCSIASFGPRHLVRKARS